MDLEFLKDAHWPKIPTTGTTSALSKDLHGWLGKVSKALLFLNEKVENLEKENLDMKNQINILKNNNSNASTDNKLDFAAALTGRKKTQEQLNLLAAVTNESKDQQIKEKNVIIFGVKSSTSTTPEEKKSDDKNELDKIMTAMEFDTLKIKNFYRLKSRNSSNIAPLIVTFDNVNIRNEALKCGKNLNNSTEYKKKIYVNPDLTESQRVNFKRLLEEKKKKNSENVDQNCYYGIRDEKVVKLKK